MFRLILSVFLLNFYGTKAFSDECTDSRRLLKEDYAMCASYENMYSTDNPLTYYIENFGTYFHLVCRNSYYPYLNGSIWGIGRNISNFACFGGVTAPEKVTVQYLKPTVQCGSVIQVINQIVGENIPLTSLPFELTYFSNRVIGRSADYKTNIKINGSYVPATATNYSINIKNESNTTIYSSNYAPAANLTYLYEWNGLDASSTETWGSLKRVITTREDSDIVMTDTPFIIYLGSFKAKKLGLGGWVPSIWHFYDSGAQNLYKGDGSVRSIAGKVSGAYTMVADEGGKEVYYFDSLGRIVETKTSLTGSTKYSFSYDSNQRLSSIGMPFSKVINFNRYLNGDIKEIVAANGTITSLTVDANGYLSEVKNAANEIYGMTYYGTGGLLNTFTKPSGDVTTLTYDTNGNLISDVHSNGFSAILNITAQSSVSKTVAKTSAMGRVMTSKVESTAETIVKPTGFQEFIGNYPSYKQFTSNRLYETTYYQNDPRFGDQSKFISSLSTYNFGSRASTFTKSATLTNSSDPYSVNTITHQETISPSINTSIYTGSNKTTVAYTKLGRLQKTQIDQYERPIMSQTGNMNARTYTYTNDLLTSTTQGTRSNTFSYNSLGLLEEITNSLSESTSFTYDSAQRLKTTTLPDNRVIEYTYDFNGNLVNITPPQRPVHQITFGLNDQISGYQPPTLSGVSNVNSSYTYNNDKQLTKITRPDGLEINYNYNATTGLMTSMTGAFGTVTKTYINEMPQLVTDQYNNKLNMSYTRGTVSGVTLVKGTTNIWSYARTPHTVGGKNANETINGMGSGSVQQVITYGYDDDEFMTTIGSLSLAYNTPNGQLTGSTLGSITDSYTYNAYGEIETYEAKYSTNVIYSYSLTRDAIGRVATKTETLNGVTTVYGYTYDSAGRLTEVTTNSVLTSTYLYDDNSNRVGGLIRGEVTSATYDDQDRLTNYNGTPLTYNANGELLTKGSVTTDYDVFGNLKSWNNGTTAITYEIDPAQRRMGRSVGGVLGARYMYSPEGRLIGQLDSTNKLVKTFVYGSKAHVPDYYVDSSNNKFRIITDHLGSVRLVVNSAGVVQQIMEHDEFGRVLQDTNAGLTPFGFAGGVYDSATGLVRFGARDYDSQVGHWASKDPVRFAGGDTNLYGYVIQDPINFIDPSGLARGDWWDPRTYAMPVLEAGQGTVDFMVNYQNMRSANTIGGDKYFHCMANCQASQRGPGGLGAAIGISEGRELFDQYVKGDSAKACNADRAANSQGQSGAGGGSCSQTCNSLRPNGLGAQW